MPSQVYSVVITNTSVVPFGNQEHWKKIYWSTLFLLRVKLFTRPSETTGGDLHSQFAKRLIRRVSEFATKPPPTLQFNRKYTRIYLLYIVITS